MKFNPFLSLILSAFLLQSCSEDLLDKRPEATDTQAVAEDAVKTKEDLQKLLISSYDVIANLYGGQIQNLSELLGDNIDAPANQNDYIQVYTRRTDIFNGTIGGVYNNAYITIYRANQLLFKKDDVTDISDAEKTQLEAEARFLRALCHHGILRLFAQPSGYTSDDSHLGIVLRMEYSQEAGLRSTVKECYDAIVEDLTFAEENLPASNGIYATKWSAKALLARVYLDQNKYSLAAEKASEVINSGQFTMLDSLTRFTAGANTEQIFATVSYNQNNISDERGGAFLNYRSDNNTNPTMRSNVGFYTTMTEDTLDLRGKEWFRQIGNGTTAIYGVGKFDRSFMWIPILHLTEMKLIRAEAYASLGTNTSTAQEDINEIRTRAGLSTLTSTGLQLLQDIRLERRKELCFEGDRTTQIKRFGVLGNESLSRNAPWNCPGMVLQFPGSENTVIGFVLNPTGGCE